MISVAFFCVAIVHNNSVVLSQLLRSSLVNHRIQATLARELGLDKLINFGGQVCFSFLSPFGALCVSSLKFVGTMK